MPGFIEFETVNGIAGVSLKKLVAVVIHEDSTCTFVCKPGYVITSLPMDTEALTKDLRARGIKVTNDPNDVVIMEDQMRSKEADEQRAEMRKHNQGVLDLAARLYHYRELPEYKALAKYVDEWLEDSDVGDLMYDLQVASDKHLNELVRAHLNQRMG